MQSSTDTLLSQKRGRGFSGSDIFIHNDKGWQMYSIHLSGHNEQRQTSGQALVVHYDGIQRRGRGQVFFQVLITALMYSNYQAPMLYAVCFRVKAHTWMASAPITFQAEDLEKIQTVSEY